MVDETKLNAFIGKILGDLGGALSTPLVGVVKVTGFADALDTPARKRRPTRQVRATPPTQSSVSACKPAG
jgi:hypothetical protein